MTGKEVTTVRTNRLSRLFLIVITAMAAVCFLAVPAQADELGFVYQNPQTGFSIYFDDQEGLLTDSEVQSLIEEMKPITEFGNVGFVSCDNYSTSTSRYAAQRYSEVFGSESGTLLVIDMGMREFYIKNNGAVSKVITSAYSNTISDNIYRYAAAGDYYSFASNCFSQIHTLLSGGRVAEPMRYISAALLALILGLTINYLILRAVTSPNKAGTHEIIDAAKVDFILRNPDSKLDHTSRVYSPVRSSSGGGGSRGGGGGFSSGGSGGGHRF